MPFVPVVVMDKNIPDTFCVLPWVGMNVHIDGGLAPCCYQSHNDVTHRFDHYPQWRGQGLHSLKQNLSQGLRDDRCSRCWKLEDDGVKSYRQNWNDAYEDQLQSIYGTPIDQLHDLRFLHLDFDNYCNLKCIMCHPTVSSSIETEYRQNQQAYEPFVGRPNLLTKPWHDTEMFDRLLSSMSLVQDLILTGGEPLINPGVLRLLKHMDLRKVNLIVTTNATVIRQEVYDILSSAKTCNIVVSLEGIGQHNEYLRAGTVWKRLESNIRWLSQRPNCPYEKMNINHTLQITSAWTLIPLLEWCMAQNYDFNINLLTFPPYLGLAGMPEAAKSQLIQELQAIKPRLWDHYQNTQILAWIDTSINDLARAIYDPAVNLKFRSYIEMLDSIRGTKFSDVFGHDL